MKARKDITAGDIIRMEDHAYRVTLIEGGPTYGQPFKLFAQQLSGEKAGRNVIVNVSARARITYLDEHFSVCRICGEVAPCRESQQEQAARTAARRMESRMSTPDGWCMACSEPITHRQQTHLFPGPNVWNPLGTDDVRFHARQSCRPGAIAYEKDWITAGTDRKPSLLTLACPGSITVHGDGTAECTLGHNCPHIYAHHNHITTCYAAGPCPRGCTQHNHPGTSLAKHLRPDGTAPR